MKRKITINYEWWVLDNKQMSVPDNHLDQLSDAAEQHINRKMEEGYVSGQLITIVEGERYQGYWKVKKEYIYDAPTDE